MSELSSDCYKNKEPAYDSKLNFLEIDEKTLGILNELSDTLLPTLEETITEWHSFLLSREETSKLLPQGAALDQLRSIHLRYFKTLLSGPRNTEYFQNRKQIGLVHQKIGVEPFWYLSAFYKFREITRRRLEEANATPHTVESMMSALAKIACLDESLALDAYFQKKNEELLDINRALEKSAKLFNLKDQELNESQEQLVKMGSIRREFLSKVSHELRTPLNAIMGYADLMADEIVGPVNAEQGRHLKKIRTHGEHLLDLIDQTIEAAKMSSGEKPDLRSFDVAPMLEQIVPHTKKTAIAKNINFEVNIAPNLPPVLGDFNGFSMAIKHLLENAVKFTEKGTVRLEAAAAGNSVKFIVSDTGPGIAEEHKKRIFGAFYQAETGDARSATGLGMGLALASQALTRMGGVLELTATGPSGSIFCARLPASPEH